LSPPAIKPRTKKNKILYNARYDVINASFLWGVVVSSFAVAGDHGAAFEFIKYWENIFIFPTNKSEKIFL
jgi:hypothetical protein